MSDRIHYTTRLRTLVQALRRARPTLARERWARERVEAYQRTLLGEMVQHASRHSRFYRDLYGGEVAAEDVKLTALPTLRKARWAEAFDDVVTDPALRLEQVEAHLATVSDDELYLGEYRIMASSGSTGRRGVYVWNRRDWLELLAIFMRPTKALGIGPRLPRMRVVLIGAPDAKHMGYRFGASMDAGVFRTLRLPATMPLDELCHEIERFRPHVLTGYASAVSQVAAEQRAGRLSIWPRAVCTNSELRTDEMTRLIRQAFSVDPLDAYALTEVGLGAWCCAEANCMHLCEDSCIIESVDEAGHPVPDGRPGSRVLVTSLLNHTHPVIRLEVSDQLTIGRELCVCGRSLRVIEQLHGRADDILDLPAAAGGRMALHPIHVRSPLAAMAEVAGYQITQFSDALDVQVILAASDESACPRLADEIGSVLRQRGVADFPVRVRAVDAINREPMGKLKLVRVVRHRSTSSVEAG